MVLGLVLRLVPALALKVALRLVPDMVVDMVLCLGLDVVLSKGLRIVPAVVLLGIAVGIERLYCWAWGCSRTAIILCIARGT